MSAICCFNKSELVAQAKCAVDVGIEYDLTIDDMSLWYLFESDICGSNLNLDAAIM